jgi:hypothetical protein
MRVEEKTMTEETNSIQNARLQHRIQVYGALIRTLLFVSTICVQTGCSSSDSAKKCSDDKVLKDGSCAAIGATLTLVGSTPPQGAVDIPRARPVTLQFSAALDPSSLVDGVVVLQAGDTVVPVRSEVDGASIQVTPFQDLQKSTTYQLKISTGLRGLAGETLGEGIALTLNTEIRSWTRAERIESSDSSVHSSGSVRDEAGNLTTAWIQIQGAHGELWSNRFEPGRGWIGPVKIASDGFLNSRLLRLVVDKLGNVTAFWLADDDTTTRLWACRREVTTGWQPPTSVNADAIKLSVSSDAAPVIDDDGNVTILWGQSDTLAHSLWANRFQIGIGWTGAQKIEGDDESSVSAHASSIDKQGNITAVWHQGSNVWANRFEVGTGWKVPALIGFNTTATVSEIQDITLSSDLKGNTTVIWIERRDKESALVANRYETGTGWKIPITLEVTDDHQISYKKTQNSSGNITVAWLRSNGQVLDLRSSRFETTTGWTNAVALESDDNGSAYGQSMVEDASGNVTVVWIQEASLRSNVWANRFEPGSGWKGATLIETNDAEVGSVSPAVDGQGNVTVAWRQNDNGVINIWANRFEVSLGWTGAVPVEADSKGMSVYPFVRVDNSGNAAVFWQRFSYDENYNLVSSQIVTRNYLSGLGWGSTRTIDAEPTKELSLQYANFDTAGNAVAIWVQKGQESDRHLMTSRFE